MPVTPSYPGVSAQRFDPYKNFKFRVKWDGRYVGGASKVAPSNARRRWSSTGKAVPRPARENPSSAFVKSPGGKASPVPCARVSPACGCAPRRGVAAHRVAQGRGRADPLLALDVAAGQHPQATRRHHPGALEDRARLSGAQKRAWPRPFRGPWLERVSSSCEPVHRRLWVSDTGAAERSRKKTPLDPKNLPYPKASGRAGLRPMTGQKVPDPQPSTRMFDSSLARQYCPVKRQLSN